jgi:hypothetical protein
MAFDEHGHILISPGDLKLLAFDHPDRLISHGLIPGTPMGFPTYGLYARFLDYLSERTGIHPHHFLFRGSTKTGFSISPDRKAKKTWRRFGVGSDLDLAITDPYFFATVDEQVRRWDRLPENRKSMFHYRNRAKLEKYQDRIKQKGRHDCYRYFDLPRGLACMTELQEVLEAAPIAECCVHPFVKFEAFIFRDRWAVHQRYLTDLDELREGLNARSNPLPQAPDEPFPSEPL